MNEETVGLWHWCKLDECPLDGPQCHTCEHMDWQAYEKEISKWKSEDL